jgi:transcriptional regulator with XRE-family HTH domain
MEYEPLFGSWLRKRRKSLDLTQKALARAVGCSPATIRKIEAEQRRPSRATAARLAQAVGVEEADQRAACLRRCRRSYSSRTDPWRHRG